ncbi:UNVERIFIED_CONTAM: hypothetical protein FKN15_006825 [Acipenser sinensis]
MGGDVIELAIEGGGAEGTLGGRDAITGSFVVVDGRKRGLFGAREQVLVEVGKVIGSYPFKFQGARILSVVEEGAYGWITINYLLSSFINAFSAFFYTFDFLKLAPQSSLDVTKKTTEEFCERDWSSLQTDFPTEKENNLREYCATSYYITTLLVDAYIFDNQSWNKIIFKKKLRVREFQSVQRSNLMPTN